MAIREGRWDCPSCGSTAIYGRHVDCPGCGKPRPAGVKFYLAHGEPVVNDPERLREARAGADWICDSCGATTRATEARCGGCGALRGTGAGTQEPKSYSLDATPRPPEEKGGGSAPGGTPFGTPRNLTGTRGPEKEMTPRRLLGYVVGGGMGLWVLGGMCAEMGGIRSERTPEPVPAVVEAVTWYREMHVQQRTLVPGEGWELPDSAVEVARSERVREHRQEVAGHRTVRRVVPRQVQVANGFREETRTYEDRQYVGTRTYVCGQRDLGNGYFEDEECTEPEYETTTRTERVTVPVYRSVTVYDTVAEQQPIHRQVPVMATYYTWRAPEWETVDTLRLSGTWQTPPEWPAVELKPDQREPEWARSEWYTALVRLQDGTQQRVVWHEQGSWKGLRPGQRVALAPYGGRRSETRLLSPDSLRACRRWHRGRGGAPPPSLGCSTPPRT